jgi:predicted oxidoreductase
VVSWFRRGPDHPPAPEPTQPVDPAAPGVEDSPDALRRRLWALVQFINHSAGRLPVDVVVVAREITDTVREVIDTSVDHDLDIYAVVQVNGIIGDYLPTTLRSYLALDPALTEHIGPSGRTPSAALREQVDSLALAADELLEATRAQDVDQLFTQGNFLRTKFTRSDLDL